MFIYISCFLLSPAAAYSSGNQCNREDEVTSSIPRASRFEIASGLAPGGPARSCVVPLRRIGALGHTQATYLRSQHGRCTLKKDHPAIYYERDGVILAVDVSRGVYRSRSEI